MTAHQLPFGLQTIPLSIVLSLALLVGCSNSTSGPSSKKPASQSTAPAATKLLTKVRQTFHQAKSYTDNTVLVFHAVVRATGSEQNTPFTRMSVAFERPNKLHITDQRNISSPQEEIYEIVADGISIRSAASELADQIHEAICPRELSAENFIPEPVLRSALLESSIENTFPQLALLFAKDTQQPIFPGETQPRKLADGQLDGKRCHRIEIPGPAGRRLLWINPDNFTLRRMELPVDNQLQALNPRNQYSEVAVWIDFESVTLDPEIEPETFTLAVPEAARRVRRFIPPPPTGPPEYLGKPVAPFTFTSLAGDVVTPQTLAGKVVVLDFWSTRCPPCKAHAPILNEVYQTFQDSADFAFLAVNADNPAVANEAIKKTMRSWGGEMPVVRDLQSSGYQQLGVRQFPTLLLVDRQGHLQSFEVGEHKRPEPLSEAIRQLLDGEDLIAIARTKHKEFLAQYEQALDVATIEDSIIEVEIARPEVPPRRLPQTLQLKQLWQTSSEQVQRPGNILALPDAAALLRTLVLDDGQAIVELNSGGGIVARHELPPHDERVGGFLRSWGDSTGQRWYLASGVGWQQIYVFDSEWQPVLNFPDQRHSGIGDVLFADLNNSGPPTLYVGYWGGLGVQAGTLDGRQLWINRKLDHVLQVGVGPAAPLGQPTTPAQPPTPQPTTWCTSTRGTLMQLGIDGKPLQERYVTGQSLMYFAASLSGQNYCGLSIDRPGQYTAVGFDASGQVAWEYPLPPGEYLEQIPRVQSVRLPQGNLGWLIAAANGSLHWLSSAGKLIDRFDTGEILTGVAMYATDKQTKLLVSTAENLTVWQLSSPVVVAEKPTGKPAQQPTDEARDAKSEKPEAP